MEPIEKARAILRAVEHDQWATARRLCRDLERDIPTGRRTVAAERGKLTSPPLGATDSVYMQPALNPGKTSDGPGNPAKPVITR